MNISPTLPNAYQPPAEHERTAVASVRATQRTRDAADHNERRVSVPRTVDGGMRERPVAHADNLASLGPPASAHASRALASYAAVADNDQRSSLHDLLGFDAYA